MNTQRLAFSSFLRRLSLGLAAATLVPSALAGTYSVVGVNWYPTTGGPTLADGGYMNFSGNDVNYGINRNISAPVGLTFDVTTNPIVQGTFAWHIRWTGTSPSDAPPASVSCTVQVNGSAGLGLSCDVFSSGYTATTNGQISDPFFPVPSTSLTDSTVGPAVNSTVSSAGNGAHTTTVGGSFYYVGGNVWEADCPMTVNTQASGEAKGDQTLIGYTKGIPMYDVHAASGIQIGLSANLHMTQIGGQGV